MDALAFSPRWMFFSEFEAELITTIADRPGSASELAFRLGIPLSGNLRYVLANLVARRVLSIGNDGYQISH